ncbi:MAG: DUF2760 domain-containing protein [Methylococcales bacterium]
MNFDPNFPASIDILHVGLAAAVLVLALLLLVLLTIIVAGLARKLKAPPLESRVISKNEKIAVESKLPPVVATSVPAPSTSLKESTPDSALQLLGLLQQEARFIDFIKEDVASYSDSDIGAAARIVHEGCSKVINSYIQLEPVRSESEDSRVTLQKGFDPARVRLTGNIVGKAPFTGKLVHRGWQTTKVSLPKIAKGHNVNIIATAEVEL